jgi:hypothetical protein
MDCESDSVVENVDVRVAAGVIVSETLGDTDGEIVAVIVDDGVSDVVPDCEGDVVTDAEPEWL